MNIRTEGSSAIEAIRHSTDNKDGEFILHPVDQIWTVSQNRAYYLASMEARGFSAMFSFERSKAMIDSRGSQYDTDGCGARRR